MASLSKNIYNKYKITKIWFINTAIHIIVHIGVPIGVKSSTYIIH